MDAPSFVVVDLDRVLNESEHGRAGLESLRALLKRATADGDALKADVLKASAPEAQHAARAALLEHRRRVEAELAKRRGALRKALVDLARRVAQNVASERGVELVLERRAVVWCPDDLDVTAEVIAGVDAARLSRRRKPT